MPVYPGALTSQVLLARSGTVNHGARDVGMADRIAELEAKLAERASRNAELEALNNALVDRVADLEAELSMNSENSSKPQQQTRKSLASRVLNVEPRPAPLVDGKENSPARRARTWPDDTR